MKKTIFFILLFFSSLFSQTDTTRKILPEKSFSLQFQVNENFSLSDFQGAIISAKYQLSDKQALRIGTSFSFSLSDKKDSNSNSSNNDEEYFSFSIITQYLLYLAKDELSLYIGFGPQYSSKYGKNSEQIDNPFDIDEVYRFTSFQNTIGVNFVYGGEMFITDFLSIMAEYGMVFEYFYRKDIDRLSAKSRIFEYRFRPLEIKIGASLNF